MPYLTHFGSFFPPLYSGLAFQLRIIKSEAPIKSIELQLVRVETCGCLEGYAKDGKVHRTTVVNQDEERGNRRGGGRWRGGEEKVRE